MRKKIAQWFYGIGMVLMIAGGMTMLLFSDYNYNLAMSRGIAGVILGFVLTIISAKIYPWMWQ